MSDPVDPAAIPSPLRLRLDGAALVENWRTLDAMSGRARAGAAVKANGYGLGAREVVKRLSHAGCCDFFVAHWREAAEIADLVPAERISVLNGVLSDELAAARAIGAKPVLSSMEQLAAWRQSGGGRCDIMFDSGMNRLGIEDVRAGEVAGAGLDCDIVMSHLASADEDVPQNASQLARYRAVAAHFPGARKSLANSAGIALGSDYHFDVTRPGLSIYGGIQRAEFEGRIAQIAFPEARILQIRQLRVGDKVGYNATFTANRDMTVAIVAIGYADGYLRGFSNGGKFTVAGRTVGVIGRISMDLAILVLPDDLIEAQARWAAPDFALPAAADFSGLSQYELLTGLGDRFDRYWR
ncbi:alanine racemase [Novosphingopyxis sp.]|uniref:alanine racemase n=1 Tax=Novosphingopyxis sp. TaxID=2709690 RepID=UPI003B5C7A7A